MARHAFSHMRTWLGGSTRTRAVRRAQEGGRVNEAPTREASPLSILRERRAPYRRGGSDLPKLLLVEDDALNRSVSARALSGHFTVTSVRSAEEALQHLERTRFEVVLTDYRMAAMTGLELLEQARVRDPRARRVLVSGTDIFGIEGYLASGIVEKLLLKPVDLRTALLTWLEAEQQRAQKP